MPKSLAGKTYIFGEGEMQSLIRQRDWTSTTLGPIEQWPQELLLTLNTVLNNQFPQMLYWGATNLLFYNDAYRISLGSSGKHPGILGLRVEEAFPEAAPLMLDLINGVKEARHLPFFEDMLLPIFRNGSLEDVYWTFSYSPVYDLEGRVAAVLASVHETTHKVLAAKKLSLVNDQLQQAITVSQLGLWEYDVPTDEFTATPLLREWLDLPEKEVYPLSEVLAKLTHDSAQKAREAIAESLQHHRPIDLAINTQPLEGTGYHLYAKGKTHFNENGELVKLTGTMQNLTDWMDRERQLHETENRLSVLADNISQLAWMTDETGYIVWYNRRWFEYTGTTLDEMEGWGWQKVHHPDHVERVTNKFKHSLAAGEDWEDTFPLKGADGKFRWFLSRAKVIKNSQGTILHWFGTNTDVTNEKEAEEDLKNREKQFRLLADFMPQFVWTADKYGALNYFNQAVFDYSGMDRQEIDRKGWLDIVHPAEREANVKAWMQSVESKQDFHFEHRFRNHSGEYRWQLSRAKPLLDAAGEVQLWVGTSTDIHEMKVLDLQKDNFISLASHELKTPVTSLKGYIQLLQEDEVVAANAAFKTSLNTMERQVNKLTSLINDLLDITRIQSGTLNIALSPVSLHEVLSETIEESKTLSKTHCVELVNEIPVMVMADKGRIGQVLANLLNNAIKYSPGKKLVRVHMKEDEHYVSVSVEDLGIGIEPAQQKEIFKNFYRVQGKNEQTFAGFGIGLFLVAEILKGHKGTIAVESEVNKGSVFTFTLPKLNDAGS